MNVLTEFHCTITTALKQDSEKKRHKKAKKEIGED